ncbi:MAG: N-acetylmuramoyl-L-alanine amidase [Holosporaceae bacterium]|jgi:N-acetyl-anhydromuramyl-L-alanine amidase AmpD|nr:N-acetylmuramoyl-L-alanine amidase [Holosporaceae bacterium]
MKYLLLNLLFGAIVVVNTFSLPIVDRHLDNADCKNGVTHRLWDEAWSIRGQRVTPPEFIVLHYTVCPNVRSTYDAYNANGVSAHFTLENDGTTYLTVDPRRYIAYHAGVSAFAGCRSLNYHSIGIENVNPGFVYEYEEIPGFRRPVQIPGDSRYWYPFSLEQFKANCLLTASLQRDYFIHGWSVVTHADIAIDRKSDVGPLWDYRRAHREYNAGFWYDESHQIPPRLPDNLTDEDYIEIIRTFGYTSDNREALIRAYQMHYVLTNISGTLTECTKVAILRHVIGLHGLVSPITGEKFEYFESKFQQWNDKNPAKAAAFFEYF